MRTIEPQFVVVRAYFLVPEDGRMLEFCYPDRSAWSANIRSLSWCYVWLSPVKVPGAMCGYPLLRCLVLCVAIPC